MLIGTTKMLKITLGFYKKSTVSFRGKTSLFQLPNYFTIKKYVNILVNVLGKEALFYAHGVL